MQQQPVADEALVHEDVDRVAIELLQFGLGVEAGEPQRAGLARAGRPESFFHGGGSGRPDVRQRRFGGHGQQLAERFLAEDLIDAFGGARDGRRGDDGVASPRSSSKCFSGWASA